MHFEFYRKSALVFLELRIDLCLFGSFVSGCMLEICVIRVSVITGVELGFISELV